MTQEQMIDIARNDIEVSREVLNRVVTEIERTNANDNSWLIYSEKIVLFGPWTHGVTGLESQVATKKQIEALAAAIHVSEGNNRPVQPLHGRKVEHFVTEEKVL